MSLTIIIISYKSLEKLEKCISNIGKNFKIIIVENSNNTEIKEKIENQYNFCKIIICHINSYCDVLVLKLINLKSADAPLLLLSFTVVPSIKTP